MEDFSEGRVPRSFDRRSALKKGAAAGAIVWTAPMIISTEAGASADTFTPKCGPTQPVRAFESTGFGFQCRGQGQADLTAQIFLTSRGQCGCSNPDLDAEAPATLGGLPLVSKTSQPDNVLGGIEFTFTYEGRRGPPQFGSFFTGDVFPVAILRCTDRSNRTEEYRESILVRFDRSWDCRGT